MTRTLRRASEAEMASELELPKRGGERLLIGRREWLALPELGVGCISAKIDTGAYTSSLHAEEIEWFERAGADWVRFVTYDYHAEVVRCEAAVLMKKGVKSSTGKKRKRVFIETAVRSAGGLEWKLRLSLADRSVMKCPMLIGRRALSGRFLVDPQKSHVFGNIHDLTGQKLKLRKKRR
ncbi:MAG: ATP-dependent zinc protease [Akkermansiaceae bacterium]|nr:ATP-dependent zinc protease [Akkermansiaceae bacterium]